MRMSDPRFTEMLNYDPTNEKLGNTDRITEGVRFDGMSAVGFKQEERGTGIEFGRQSNFEPINSMLKQLEDVELVDMGTVPEEDLPFMIKD